ncbi:MAG: PEGA domain-containing protein [bacterium]|nr:PEGA domain-containing protein [bacterium]
MKIIIDTTKNIVPRIIIGVIFILVLMSVIAYARGYRFNIEERTISSTGILSVTSNPKPASVFIDDELVGATDENLTLPYGHYSVEVRKEGYTSWKKDVSLKGEIVMSLNAILFSKNPSLTPLTNLGILTVLSIENTDKIIVMSKTGDIEKDGVYLFEPSNRPAVIFPPLKLLMLASILPQDLDMSNVTADFDPNHKQSILNFVREDETTVSYLISLDQENGDLIEVTSSRDNILAAWKEERDIEITKIIETFPPELEKIASDSFQIISLSPDEKKVLYIAEEDGTLPLVINPPLIGANQTQEERDVQAGAMYIYDKKEDKNFRIPIEADNQKSVKWYPTSDYVAVQEEGAIVMIQYDGTNKEIVYAGPYDNSFFGISPDWNLIVVINLNPQLNEYGDLYSVGIR